MPSPVTDAIVIGILYLGPGFFASRFLRSSIRNAPLTWIFLSIILAPLFINLLSLITGSHIVAFGFATLLLCLGLVLPRSFVERGSVPVLEEILRVKMWERILTLALLTGFFTLLVIPKLSLIFSDTAIGDDPWRIGYVVSMGSDLARPLHFQYPAQQFIYYYYDYILPGIVFKLTSFSARTAYFIHTLLEYAAILGFLSVLAGSLFKKPSSRLYFLAFWTIAGGLDYFLLRLVGAPVIDHLEWWVWLVPLTNSLVFQISAPFTSFIYVPHHLLGLMIYVCILLLSGKSDKRSLLIISALFAALLGTSAFVFVTAAVSYSVARLLRLPTEVRLWKTSLLQAVVFLALSAKMLLMSSAKAEGLWTVHTLLIPFINLVPSSAAGLIADVSRGIQWAINLLVTLPFILSVDMGIAFALGVSGLIAVFARVRRGRTQLTLPYMLFVTTVTTLILLSFLSMGGLNELFMRGILIVQMSLVIAGAWFLDGLHGRRQAIALSLAGLFLLLQLPHFVVEWQGRSNYPWRNMDPLLAYIRDQTPKDAVIYASDSLCGPVSILGNRLCQAAPQELGAFELNAMAVPPVATVDYKNVLDVLRVNRHPNAYFIARDPISHARLHEVFLDAGRHIYRMERAEGDGTP